MEASRSAPVAVLKFGGEVVAERTRLGAVMREVAALRSRGWSFVLCHGGGPQASALQLRLGMESTKVRGVRVTDLSTLQVMKQVLAGEVSTDVVATALAAGIDAVGLSGVSAELVRSRRKAPVEVPGQSAPVDYGCVGEVEQVRAELFRKLLALGLTPVLNSLTVAETRAESGGPRTVLNVNADDVASAVAGALGADHLFLMTGVPGVLRDKEDPTSRIPRMTPGEARAAIAEGVVVGGMIPKVEGALAQIARGVGQVHILGAGEGSLQQEAQEPGSVGTVFVRDIEA